MSPLNILLVVLLLTVATILPALNATPLHFQREELQRETQQQAILKAQVERIFNYNSRLQNLGYVYMKPKIPFNVESIEVVNSAESYHYPRPMKVFNLPARGQTQKYLAAVQKQYF